MTNLRFCDKLNKIYSGNTSHIILPSGAKAVWDKIVSTFLELCKSNRTNPQPLSVYFIANESGTFFSEEGNHNFEEVNFSILAISECAFKAKEQGLYVEHTKNEDRNEEIFYFSFTPACLNPFSDHF